MTLTGIYDFLVHQLRAGKKEQLIRRLSRNVRHKEDGCIEYSGAVNNKGYAKINFRVEGVGHAQVYAHRLFMVLMLKRDIQNGYEVDHICNNRRCVKHLREVPIEDNRTRANRRRARR
jgi:hypothetical protein